MDRDAIACEHCGGVVPQVSLGVASLDGTTLVVTLAQRGLVREVKRLVGQVRARVLKRGNCRRLTVLSPSRRRAAWTRA